MIIKCTCKNEFQDKRYGKQKRVANPATEKGVEGYRCTVCAKHQVK